MTNLLLVEDDASVRDPLASQLIKTGFSVKACANLAEARGVSLDKFDLVILDWELPDGEGIDLLKQIRASGSSLPVIFLTARVDLTDKIVGLEVGADDYVTKPFEFKELVARIRARTRQTPTPQKKKLEVGDLSMDLESHKVFLKGVKVELAKMEFMLLKFFMENIERALARDEILNRVWGFDNFPSSRTVDSHVLILRQKIGEEYFETLRGIGYRFKDVK